MSIRNIMKHLVVLNGLSLVVALLLIAGCGNGRASSQSKILAGNTTVGAIAILKHTPSGVADLAWTPQTEELTVKISLIGLVPKSTHPAHIYLGACNRSGKVVYGLRDIVADEEGAATVTTTLPHVKTGIPAAGWSLNVHNGPAMATAAQALPITCGSIVNPHASTKVAQSVRALLGNTASPNQAASGTVQMTYVKGKLQVITILSGLAPRSIHAAHIHAGSCAEQGNVLFTLQPVVADASGKGVSKSTLNNISSIPASGWYVNVHLTTNMSTQTGMDSIACGDVVLTH